MHHFFFFLSIFATCDLISLSSMTNAYFQKSSQTINFSVGSIPDDEEDEQQQLITSSSSKYRRIASQLCGVLASDCLRFTTSSFSGFHIVLIAELHRDDSLIPITLDQLTWFGNYISKLFFFYFFTNSTIKTYYYYFFFLSKFKLSKHRGFSCKWLCNPTCW